MPSSLRCFPSLVLRLPRLPFLPSSSARMAELFLSDDICQEALFVSSPSLYETSKRLQTEPQGSLGSDKVALSLSKYLSRMRSRCTPFGLMAGCTVVPWGEEASLMVDSSQANRRTSLDMQYVYELAHTLAQQPFIKPKLRYFTNNSVYALGDEVRYVERVTEEGQAAYQLSSVTTSDILTATLSLGHSGATVDQLIRWLTDQHIDEAAAAVFIAELIDAQLLISELHLGITHERSVSSVVDILQLIPAKTDAIDQKTDEWIKLLQEVDIDLRQLDATPPNVPEQYQAIANKLTTLPVAVGHRPMFKVDWFPSASGMLGQRAVPQLLAAVDFLSRVVVHSPHPRLEKFRQSFHQRYEGAVVPLSVALDTETGIGYGHTDHSGHTPLTDGLVFSEVVQHDPATPVYPPWLQQRIQQAVQEKLSIIQLNEEDLVHLPKETLTYPPSMSAVFRMPDKETLFLEGVSGPSAVNLLSRFAYGDERMSQLTQQVCQHEQKENPAVVFAEIIHVPEYRVGNILNRPALRSYEIPYLTPSSLDSEHQIPLRELSLFVWNDRLVLWCQRLNKEVIPRHSTAHNYEAQSLPVYRFLCDLQNQGSIRSLRLHWHPQSFQTRFLPRFMYQDTLLGVATWYLSRTDLSDLLNSHPPDLLSAVEHFRRRWQLPLHFVLADEDRELLVDSTNELSLLTWLDTIKDRDTVLLKEFLFDTASALVVDQQGDPYVNQWVAPLLSDQPTYHAVDYHHITTHYVGPQAFMLGSEWLYYKLYCGVQSSDIILLQVIYPLTQSLFQEKKIDRWFFIRYTDPDAHLRVRFRVTDRALLGEVIQAMHERIQTYETSQHIWKSQTDTYRREIARYGGEKAIELAEQLFYYDSLSVLTLLDKVPDHERADQRWLWSLKAVDEMLTLFGYDVVQKKDAVGQYREAFAREFAMDKSLQRQIDQKYRLHQETIYEMLTSTECVFYHPDTHHVVDQILALESQQELSVPINRLIGSYLHMHVNRMITTSQRLHELILYDFLSRYYRSHLARQK